MSRNRRLGPSGTWRQLRDARSAEANIRAGLRDGGARGRFAMDKCYHCDNAPRVWDSLVDMCDAGKCGRSSCATCYGVPAPGVNTFADFARRARAWTKQYMPEIEGYVMDMVDTIRCEWEAENGTQ